MAGEDGVLQIARAPQGESLGRSALSLLIMLAACAIALLAPGCAGGATAAGAGVPVPLKAVGSASGDSAGPQVFLLEQPMNALVRIHGDVKYTIQPFPPYVTLDGDFTIIVEPLPGREAEAQLAVASGDLLIRRSGKPGALNAPGSVRAWKAARERLYAPPPQPVRLPPPPPTPEELKPQPMGMAPTFCDPNDPACQAPAHAH